MEHSKDQKQVGFEEAATLVVDRAIELLRGPLGKELHKRETDMALLFIAARALKDRGAGLKQMRTAMTNMHTLIELMDQAFEERGKVLQ